MHPKYKKKSAKATNGANGNDNGKAKEADGNDKVFDEERDRQARLFPGLAIPDSKLKPMDKFVEEEQRKQGGAAHVPDVDDLMRELEGVAAKKTGNRMTADDFMEAGKDGNDDGRASKRQRMDDSSASTRGRSPPPSGRDNGYASRGRQGYGGGDRGGYAKTMGVDEKPVLYKIYDGKVSNVREFGAFVQLEGVAGRVEGKCAKRRYPIGIAVADIDYDISKEWFTFPPCQSVGSIPQPTSSAEISPSKSKSCLSPVLVFRYP
jgi:ATP-dependent RNA helicase DHX8/PRP22